MNRIIQKMSTDRALNTASFCAGFIWTIGSPLNLFAAPLSATFIGAIGGGITYFGASLVDGFLPLSARPILVGGLFGSAALYGIGYTYSDYQKIIKGAVTQSTV